MRLMTLSACALVAATAFFTTAPADAQEYPWCVQYGGTFGGGRNCGFSTYAQCMAARSGVGGFCERNPFYRGGAYAQERPYRKYRRDYRRY